MIPRQSVQDLGTLLRSLFANVQEQQARQAASQQAQGFFTQPSTQMDVPLGTMGANVPMNIPTGAQRPDLSAILSALFSSNQYSQQNAKNALGASEMFQPKYQTVNQEGGGLQLVTTPPFGGKPTAEQMVSPTFKPVAKWQPRMQDGKPVTEKFGNTIRTIYDEYVDGQPTGNFKYESGGTLPSPNTGLTIIQTPEGFGVANKVSGTVSPLKNQQGTQQQLAPTAEMRNKVSARQLVQTSIDAVKSLSDEIITNVGVAQRASAIKRGAEAVFGSDPKFRTYQDARMALAGNLAVAQQGSRPSDADIKAIWMPLVPDPYRDTRESAEMKWQLIRTMSLPQQQGSGFQEFNVGGKTYKIPDNEVEQFKKDMGIK